MTYFYINDYYYYFKIIGGGAHRIIIIIRTIMGRGLFCIIIIILQLIVHVCVCWVSLGSTCVGGVVMAMADLVKVWGAFSGSRTFAFGSCTHACEHKHD